MSKKPAWVIFDVGQVLYNFHDFSRHLAGEIGIEEKDLFSLIDLHTPKSMEGQVSVREYWVSILKDLNIEEKIDKVMDIWTNDLKFWLKDTGKLLTELEKSGYNLAIFTNNWGNQTEDLNNHLSKYAQIKFMFESSVEKLRKPDVKFYQLVEKRTGANGADILFIDDREENLETGKSMGWQTFLYTIGDDDGKSSNDLIRKELL